MADGRVQATRNRVVKIYGPELTVWDLYVSFSIRPRRTRDDAMVSRETGFTSGTRLSLAWGE